MPSRNSYLDRVDLIEVEYPNNVHLIRGNHEAADINALFGFRIECIERMGERDGIWAWHHINRLFNWLPLAALIEKKIICMHEGIGRSINHVEQIENIHFNLRDKKLFERTSMSYNDDGLPVSETIDHMVSTPPPPAVSNTVGALPPHTQGRKNRSNYCYWLTAKALSSSAVHLKKTGFV
ncbi:hypothetical protein Fmac_008586 [Flemingia macrophylla]|uniref:Serine/threonine specific protein phosphatases domain-containing protein n=1 Tax=Flemingia macrophylla TaxID=520843 RepID=A0ABD1MXT6_9FABA